jgi:hypothetical protein
MSLVDWSSSLTNNKTNWIVASVDEKIIIKEEADLQSHDFGEFSINTDYPAAEDVLSWEVLESNYLTNIQTQLVTSGISAVSGLYCERKNDIVKDKVVVNDDNTSNKKNVDIKSDQGFAKPTDKERGITYVRSVPEDSAGSVGLKYQDYIDGRARGIYLGMLSSLFKIKIRVFGSPKFHDSSQLGVSTVTLGWNDYQGQPFQFNGKWLVYGFTHTLTPDKLWYTDIILCRKDFDSSSQKV